ncbi:hypothetical protein N9N67_02235 [Bacteriovoracaceae bacterium]|nr:hypothetical protein [Bacteriovoracaceae bacterium]
MKIIIQHFILTLLIGAGAVWAQKSLEIENDPQFILSKQESCSLSFHVEDVISKSIGTLYSDGSLELFNDDDTKIAYVVTGDDLNKYLVIPFGNESNPDFFIGVDVLVNSVKANIWLETVAGKINISCEES